MSHTFTVSITVPDGYVEQNDVPTVEEAIAAAVADLNGDELAVNFEDDEYDAAIDHSTWEN